LKKVASRIGSHPAKKEKSVSKHYCTEHGQNPTHSTADCWTINNRAKAQTYNPEREEEFLESKSQK
jgi:hypothetical protein